MYIFLKSKRGTAFKDRRYALLINPANPRGFIGSDEELYVAVKQNGSATIQNIENLEIAGDPQVMSPEDFEVTWMGD